MSTKSEGLQNCLDKFANYCSKWGLSMNYKKTKISDLKQLLKLLSIFTLRTLHEYIDLIILKNLPLIPFFRSLYNNAEWMTVKCLFKVDKFYLGSESINCLLYADDLVLMSTKSEGLQIVLISLPTTAQNGAYQ
jgi:hypothetical protein